MPQKWSTKDERKYQHIKKSEHERGVSLARAKEVAARTVNKARRLEGRTRRRTASGTGNPNRPLEERTVQELRNRAGQLHIEGRARMRKGELVSAIRAAQ